MGTAALTDRDYVHEAIDQADLILSIGHDTIEKPPFIMGPKGPKVIHVGYTPANDRKDGTYRKIDIKLSNKDLKAQARKGYYAIKPETR